MTDPERALLMAVADALVTDGYGSIPLEVRDKVRKALDAMIADAIAKETENRR
jgi:hypothetical protein